MDVRIEEEPIDHLDDHALISIAFTVQRTLLVSTPDSGLGGIQLNEVDAEKPWVKDYDAIKGEGPTRWLTRFDTSNWGLIAAHHAEQRIGGAVIAFDTPGLHLLDGQRDLAVLWDFVFGLTFAPQAWDQCYSSPLRTGANGAVAEPSWSRRRTSTSPRVDSTSVWVAFSAQSTPGPIPIFRTRLSCSGSRTSDGPASGQQPKIQTRTATLLLNGSLQPQPPDPDLQTQYPSALRASRSSDLNRSTSGNSD